MEPFKVIWEAIKVNRWNWCVYTNADDLKKLSCIPPQSCIVRIASGYFAYTYTHAARIAWRERVTMFNPTSTPENLNGIHKLCLKREHTHTQYPGTGNSFCVKFANKIPQGRIHIQHFSLCCFFFVASQAFKMVKAYFANDFNTYISEWE